MNSTRVVKRPGGLLTPEQTSSAAWTRLFGDIDATPRCACCGAALSRYAAVTATGDVYGLACAVTAGLIDSRDHHKAATPPYVHTPSARELAWIADYPAAWDAVCAAVAVGADFDALRATWEGAGGHYRLRSTMPALALRLGCSS